MHGMLKMLIIKEENNMPGTVIGTSLNLGYAGKISRNGYNTITSRFILSILDGNGNETMPQANFGDALVLNTNNTYSKFGTVGVGVSLPTAANFAGFAVAETKQVMSYGYGSISSTSGYVGGQSCDALLEGSITAFCKEGTPTAGGAVYVVTVAAASGALSAVGDLIANAVPAGTGSPATINLVNVNWKTGKVDKNLISELTILSNVRP
jgi:hypothetical protein